MYLVFCTFKDSLFSFNQFITLLSSLLISKLALCGVKCSLLKYSVVSSAYKRYCNLSLELIISLTYMLKSSGPRIEPCGIPVVIMARSDLVLLNKTYYIRPVT